MKVLMVWFLVWGTGSSSTSQIVTLDECRKAQEMIVNPEGAIKIICYPLEDK